MLRARKLTWLFSYVAPLLLSFFLNAASLDAAAIDAEDLHNVTISRGAGTGAYFPLTGFYFGNGETSPFGGTTYSGNIELDDLGNGRFQFQNVGRGTDNEMFQENIYEDGSSLSTRMSGFVQLLPELDDNGQPTGFFTAHWEGVWRVVKGTGRFRNARGIFFITAINDPFNPQIDPHWTFTWSWVGVVRTRRTGPHDCPTRRLSAQGLGVFDPANLGLGDPGILPFPLIIGDGSGEGIYDGTPMGNNFRLNGQLVADGFDQHFGTAQSISPGLVSSTGTVWFPGVTGANPDGSDRAIHIMDTRIGELWFNYRYFFELDNDAGVIIGRADFRVVGGTEAFKDATGSVFVRVVANLADITGLPNNPAAPFEYDFRGYVNMCTDD